MPSAVARGVFISYSRVNGEVVTIAAKLLKAGGATVFQDVVDIDYGSDWQEALASAIRQCERVLVFWSLAASTSEWVEREWRMALQAGKRIVPMLLDKTPLPTELSRFNGMPELMQLLMLVKQPSAPEDVSGVGSGTARALPKPAPPAPARRRSFLLPAIGAAFATVFCGALFYGLRPQADRPEALGQSSGAWLAAIAVAVFLLLGVAASFLFGRQKGKPKTERDATRMEEGGDPFSVEASARRSWEENVSILDLGGPPAASSDIPSRLVLEIGPLFTRQLFD